MRRQVIGLAVLTAALVTPAWSQDKAPDDEKLFGTWAITSLEFMDMKKPIPEGFEQSFTFAKGGKVTMKITGKPAEEGSYKLGAVKMPREIDITGPSSDGKKMETIKALYQIDGDTMKMAFPIKGPEGDRPTSLDPKTTGIMTFKRQKS